jgi:hypothetical protein
VHKFILENRGFAVFTATNALEATEGARGFNPELAIGVLPFDGELATLFDALHVRHPQMRSMVIAERLTERPPLLIVDAVLLKGQCSQFEILDRVFLLSTRKRGPRKFRPAAERGIAAAYLGVMETVGEQTA